MLRTSLAALLLWPPSTTAAPVPASSVQIVLAHCNESLTWLNDLGYGSLATVYDKCGDAAGPGHHIAAPNVGRESGTYLQHIVDHYDSLADWTVFSQAEAPTYGYQGHRRGGGHLMQNVKFQDYVDAAAMRHVMPRFFVFTGIVKVRDGVIYQSIRRGYGATPAGAPTPMDAEEKACGLTEEWEQWYAFPEWFSIMVQDLQQEQRAPLFGVDEDGILRLFDVQAEQGLLFFSQGARFALSREAIQSRPKEYYQQLLRYLQHPDPWAGYVLEWLWWYVMGGDAAPCGFEGQVADDFGAWLTLDDSRRMVAQQVSGTGECVWGAWQAWQCTVSCGNGTQYRDRSVQGNGTCGGASRQTNSTQCNTDACNASAAGDAAVASSCQLQNVLCNPFINPLATLTPSQLANLYAAADVNGVCPSPQMTTYFTSVSSSTSLVVTPSYWYLLSTTTSMSLTVMDWGAGTVFAAVTIHTTTLAAMGLTPPVGVFGLMLFAATFERSTGSLIGEEAALANLQPLSFAVTTTDVTQVAIYRAQSPGGSLIEDVGGWLEVTSTQTIVYVPGTSTIVGFTNGTNTNASNAPGGQATAAPHGSDMALLGLLALLVVPLLLCAFAGALLWRRWKWSHADERMLEARRAGRFPDRLPDVSPFGETVPAESPAFSPWGTLPGTPTGAATTKKLDPEGEDAMYMQSPHLSAYTPRTPRAAKELPSMTSTPAVTQRDMPRADSQFYPDFQSSRATQRFGTAKSAYTEAGAYEADAYEATAYGADASGANAYGATADGRSGAYLAPTELNVTPRSGSPEVPLAVDDNAVP